MIVSLFALTWQADNGGLFIGSMLGRVHFAFHLSPNKTREGIYGAVFLCFFSSFLMWIISNFWSDLIFQKLYLEDYLVIGLVTGILAMFSDLTESFIKRCASVKDSGTLLPGHGGFFDRVDSLLLPIPFVYWYMSRFMPYTMTGGTYEIGTTKFLHLYF